MDIRCVRPRVVSCLQWEFNVSTSFKIFLLTNGSTPTLQPLISPLVPGVLIIIVFTMVTILGLFFHYICPDVTVLITGSCPLCRSSDRSFALGVMTSVKGRRQTRRKSQEVIGLGWLQSPITSNNNLRYVQLKDLFSIDFLSKPPCFSKGHVTE